MLILDEPTNNLDRASETTAVQGRSRRWRGPAILVSHDRELLDLVEEIAELRDGELRRFFGGNFTAFTEALGRRAGGSGPRRPGARKGDLRRQQRELAEMRIKLDRRQRYARSQAENVPKIVAGRQEACCPGFGRARLVGGHEADVAEARQHLASAEERVRDDALIRIDLSATTVPAGRDVLVVDGLRAPEPCRRVRPDLAASAGARAGRSWSGQTDPGKTTLINTLLGSVPAVVGHGVAAGADPAAAATAATAR